MMMSEIAGAAWVLPLTFALQGISAALILARLVRGPRAADRVVAIGLGAGPVMDYAIAAAEQLGAPADYIAAVTGTGGR